MTYPLLSFLVVVFVATECHCAEQAPPPRLKTVYYFPITEGSKWVYKCHFKYSKKGFSELEYTLLVASVEDGKDGAKLVTVDHIDSYRRIKEVFEVSERGLFLIKTNEETLDHPKCLLKMPHTDGQTWRIYPDNPSPSELMDGLVAHGPIKQTVPAGHFNCIQVSSPMFGDNWYAPGVGLIKFCSKTGSVAWVLQSFTPGKN